MSNLITELEKILNIKFIESSSFIPWENSYHKNSRGEVTKLCLVTDIPTFDLSLLLPISTSLEFLLLSVLSIQNINIFGQFISLTEFHFHNALCVDMKFLSPLSKQLKVLHLSDLVVENFSLIKDFTELEGLHLIDSTLPETNFENFFSITLNLKFLSLVRCGVTDISFIKQLSMLEQLSLTDISLKNLKNILPIADKLKILKLVDCEIENIDEIECFKNLEKLDLSISSISDLEGIQYLQGLKELILSCINIDLIDLSVQLEKLKVLKHLEILNLDSNSIENIDTICSIPSLKTLILSSNNITEITNLEKFPHLEELNISSNRITEIKGLEVVAPSLKKLDASCSWITKIEGLETLNKLEELDLSSNEGITKIEGLESLKNLKKLLLYHTSVERIQDIEHLKKLKELSLSYSKLEKVDNLPSNLKNLYLHYNKISEIDISLPFVERIDLKGNRITDINEKFISSIQGHCNIDLKENPINYIKVNKINVKHPKIEFILNDSWSIVYNLFMYTESRLTYSKASPIIGTIFSNQRHLYQQVVTNENYPLTNFPFLLYKNGKQKSQINNLEKDLGVDIQDFENLLSVFITIFDTELKPTSNERASLIAFIHLLCIQLSIFKLTKDVQETLKSYFFEEVLFAQSNLKGLKGKFSLKENSIYYYNTKIDISQCITIYFNFIKNNYDTLEINFPSLEIIETIYNLLKEIGKKIIKNGDRSYVFKHTYTFRIIEKQLFLYKDDKIMFYKSLAANLDYFNLPYEPKEIMNQYLVPKERYSRKLQWETENKVYSYILYIFNDINSLKELLLYVKNESKKHRLLNIIFSHPIITRNNKKYDFINEEVLELLPQGHAKSRVKQLLEK